jgi:hypothetical protein
VLVLNPLYVKECRGTTLRRTKTDPVEARLIAELLQREQVFASHVPEVSVQGLRDLTRLHADPEFATCFTDVCGQTARTLLETWTLPEDLLAGRWARLPAVLARLPHGYFRAEKAREVKVATQQSIGV